MKTTAAWFASARTGERKKDGREKAGVEQVATGSAYLDGYKNSWDLDTRHRNRQTLLELSEAKKG